MNFRELSKRPIDFLIRFPALNVIVIIIYYTTFVLLHEWFENIILHLFRDLSRGDYQLLMLMFALFFILIYMAYMSFILKRNFTYLSFFTLLTLLILTGLSYYLLIIHYVEAIHFLQYAILAFLMFPLSRKYYKVLFWGLILAFLDEAYQYFYLKPFGTQYYDFNDVLLNQLGLVYGLLPFAIQGGMSLKPKRTSIKEFLPETAGILVLAGILIILILANFLSIYPNQEIPYNLVRNFPESFWSEIKSIDAVYHIVLPVEGLFLTGSVYFLSYYTLVRIHLGRQFNSQC